MAKIGIISLGCPRNLVDSEAILGSFKKRGDEIVDIDKADTAIVNTCSFIEDARVESIDTILELCELKKKGKIKRLLVAGCLPRLYKDKLAGELKEVDEFIDTPDFTKPADLKFNLTPPHTRYIKILEGCGNSCSFCLIPRIKGPLKSRPMDSILDEIRSLPPEVQEINMVGQDTTLYGMDIYRELKLASLLQEAAKLNKVKWIRLLYAHPEHINDELIKIIREGESICKYLDLPLQHINDRILKSMNRNTTGNGIISLVEKLRYEIPRLALRTAFIVGFPGETDTEFKELLSFLRKIKFERLGVFTYSREDGTAAAGFKNQVPEEVKEQRFNEIMSLQQEISAELNKKFLGKEISVLIDEEAPDEHGLFLGRSEFDAPEVDGQVWVKSSNAAPGEILKVRITDTLEYDLVGETA